MKKEIKIKLNASLEELIGDISFQIYGSIYVIDNPLSIPFHNNYHFFFFLCFGNAKVAYGP